MKDEIFDAIAAEMVPLQALYFRGPKMTYPEIRARREEICTKHGTTSDLFDKEIDKRRRERRKIRGN